MQDNLLTMVPYKLDLLMPLTKNPASPLSCSYATNSLQNPENVCKEYSSRDLYGTFIPCRQASLGALDVIITYLFYDMRSLRACAMTCRSWYTATVPHLNRTLTIETYSRIRSSRWPNPLRRRHALRLLPLVKYLWVYGCNNDNVGLSPTLFSRRTLCQVSALTNVQELEVGYLDIPNFIPQIQQYFKHFLPTLRSLGLREPRGSNRWIIYFIGLFQHLPDLSPIYREVNLREQAAIDLTLVPPFVPPAEDVFHNSGPSGGHD